MAGQYTLDSNTQKNIMIAGVIGIVLLGLGLWLSTLGGGEGHGHDDGNGAATEDTHGDASATADDNMVFYTSHGAGQQEHHMHPTPDPGFMGRLGTVVLTGTWYVFVIALFGTFFTAVSYVANAGWYVVVKRILESYWRWLPVAAILFLVIYFVFGDAMYDWVNAEAKAASGAINHVTAELVHHKSGFLNMWGVFALVGVVGFYALIGFLFRKNSLAEDNASEGDISFHKKSVMLAAIFLPVFGLGFSAICFLFMMSLDVTWFSTIYAVYCFAGLFVGGATLTALIASHLKDKGFLPEVNGEHLHDIGKFMFAFSIFWAYIWVSQYLLIWYANMPEETQYYFMRYNHYSVLFWFNLVVNFFTPFLYLMTRDAKRVPNSLYKIGGLILFGRFLDVFLLVTPGVMGEHWNGGLLFAAGGMVLIQGAAFLYLVLKGLESAPLLPKNHPYLKESFHHDTGV